MSAVDNRHKKTDFLVWFPDCSPRSPNRGRIESWFCLKGPHMSQQLTLAAVADMAAQLTPTEQKQLAETILQRLTSPLETRRSPRRAWREIRGSVPYPLLGEDAQAWVSRGREESEKQRE
jgi:hypothetical protein